MEKGSNKQALNKRNARNFTIDFRNCKYHGQVNNSEYGLCPSGFGIILDQNYTWIAAEWSSFKISKAPSAAVFSDSDKIYCNQGFNYDSIFQLSFIIYEGQGFRIYKINEYIILDLIDYKEQKQHYQNSLFKFSIKKAQSKNKNDPKIHNLQLIQHKPYTEEYLQQKMAELVNISEDQQIQFEDWLRKNLRNKLSIFPNSHSKSHANKKRKLNELYIELLNQESSIGLRMIYKKRFEATKMYFSTKNQVISKKWSHYEEGGYLVEELIGGQLDHYIEYQDLHHNKSIMKSNNSKKIEQNELLGRPNEQIYKQCTRNLQQYYKRSLNFTNKYLSLTSIYNLRQQFKQIFNICLAILQQQEIKAHQNRTTLTSYLKNKQSWQQQKEEETQNQNKVFEASIDDIKKQLIRTEMMAKSKSRVLEIANSNIRNAERKNLTPSNRKYPVYNQRQQLSVKPMNQSMFKTSYQPAQGLNRRPKQKKHIYDNDNSLVRNYQYFFDEEDKVKKSETNKKSNIKYQNFERKQYRDNLPPTLRLHQKMYEDNQQQFPYRYEPVKQNMFKPLVPNSELRNNQYSREQSVKDQTFYSVMNAYPTNNTSLRSNPQLQALTLNYEDIEQEIIELQKEKQSKLKGAAKNSSTKHTSARSNKLANVSKNAGYQDQTSNNNSASKSKSQSRSPSPYVKNNARLPSKISQLYQKTSNKKSKSRYLKI